MRYKDIKKAHELHIKWQELCREEQRVLSDFRVSVVFDSYIGGKTLIGSDEVYNEFGIDGEFVRETLKDAFLVKMDRYASKLLDEMLSIRIETTDIMKERETYLKEWKR